MKKSLIIGFLLVLFSTAALADDIMNNPVTVAHLGGKVRWSQIALGPDGVAHVVFIEILDADYRNIVMYVKYDGKTASTPIQLNEHFDDYCQQPNIAVSSRGVVVAVWGQPREQGVFMRVFDPAVGDWSAVEQVSGWGQDEPSVVVESNGNIHVHFWNGDRGRVMARSKINGVWEDEVLISKEDARCMKGQIALGVDGVIWICWMQRNCGNPNACEYKTHYSTRTATTSWTPQTWVNESGLSQELCFIAVGPNGIPWVTWGDTDEAEQTAIVVSKLNGADNPIEFLTARGTQHGPRVAADVFNNAHIACQQGGGDFGNGILYLTNMSGVWQSQMMWGGYTKAGGVSADGFGNVAVCWSGWFGAEGSEVYINSLTPIAPKYFLPPVNLSATLSLSGVRQSPRVTYTLSWNANPNNTESYLSGYKIYVKENAGSYQLLATVGKTTFSRSFDFTDLSKKRKFAITTANLAGAESELSEYY
jgi:hypothetical protein